jgi:hypothetical protein
MIWIDIWVFLFEKKKLWDIWICSNNFKMKQKVILTRKSSLWLDHWSKYLSYEFSEHLKSCGSFPTTCASRNAPYNDGVSVRCNLTLLDLVRSIMSVYWVPGYPDPPAPGPLQWHSFGIGARWRLEPNKEDPHEEEPHEENDDETLRTRRPPHDGPLVRRETRSTTA